MTKSRASIDEIFFEAFSLTSIAKRDAFLKAACEGDVELRARVDQLLVAYPHARSLLETPPFPVVDTADPIPVPSPGHEIGPYRILEKIAEGGMGAVYVAEQTEPVRRKVALKIIRPAVAGASVVARFEAERQALAMMDHPNIARVLDGGATDDELPYFVMELVQGLPITEYCDQKRLSTRQRLELFVDVCRAVEHAHQKGVIHRDLKPTNILVAEIDGKAVPKVIDFGVAKALHQKLTDQTVCTQFTQMVGTPLYMSPEQAGMGVIDIDTRSDVYSLGVVMYELLTGKTPFDRETLKNATFDEMRRIIREDEPPRPSWMVSSMATGERSAAAHGRKIEPGRLVSTLRGELDWIVMKAIEKDRDRRYASARSFGDDIGRYLRDVPVKAGPPSVLYRSKKYFKRHATLLTATALIALTLVAATLVSVRKAIDANNARRLAGERLALATERLSREQKARAEAESLRKTARDSARELRNLLYSSDILLASRTLGGGDIRVAGEILRRLQPILNEVDVRGPEWNMIWRGTFPERRTLVVPHQDVHDVEYSRDGRLLVTCGDDDTINVFDASNDQPIRSIQTEHGEIEDITFLDRGSKLAVAGGDGRISIWQLGDGTKTLSFQAHPVPINHIAYSPTHNTLVTCAGERSVRFWDADTGESLRTLQPHGGSVAAIDVSRDGAFIATAALDKEATAAVWHWNSLEKLNTLSSAKRFPCLSFSQDGRWLGLGSLDRATYFRNQRTWDPPAGFVHQDGIECITFSADGRWGADGDRGGCLGIWPVNAKATAQPWEGANTVPRIWAGHTGRVRSVCFSPDGRQLASCGQDGVVRIWDVEQCARSSRWNLASSKDIAADFAFLDDARLVTLSSFEIAVVDPKRYTPVQSFPLEGVGRLSMCLARDGVVLGDRQGGIELRDLETFSLKGAWRDTDQQSVNWLGFAPNHHLVFARTDQGMVVLSYPNLERVEGYPSEWCNALTLSIDGERFARADAPQNTVSVWKTHPPTRLMTFTGYGDAIHCLAFSPDGRYVVSGDGERLIRVWDLESGKEVRRLSGHRGRVDCVVFSADSRTLISQCREYGTIKFWNLETGRELASVGDRSFENLPVRRLALSPSGNLLAFREKESKVGILDLSPVAEATPADK